MGDDPTAWDEIVERYAPLVWSICAQLSNDHREDAGQKISEKPQIPTGSIGPRRARRPERLRKYSAPPGLGGANLHWAGGEHCA
jgi:hypothetical protein